jgi:outer membrane protein
LKANRAIRKGIHTVAAVLMLAATVAWAQTLSIAGVVQDAERDYPLIHVTEAELNASIANIRLSRTAYLPRVDGIAQFNRGTRNNVFGALLPQSVVPSMSGPAINSNNGGSVWGSGTGLLVNWQPFDFGLRGANVQSAVAARDKADATVKRTQLEVSTAAADAYLTVLVAGQTKQAAQAAVDNWETLRQSVHALTLAELRPGADESRIDAEKAVAMGKGAGGRCGKHVCPASRRGEDARRSCRERIGVGGEAKRRGGFHAAEPNGRSAFGEGQDAGDG